MGTATEEKKQIERLLKKCDIKEANGMNSDKELTEALELMAMHPMPQEIVDAYVDGYTKLALSILDETGEPLSDIPMGRARQFVKIMEQEYISFKNAFKNYKQNKCDTKTISTAFERFDAVSELLSDTLVELGDKKTTFIEGFDKIEELNKPNINYVKFDDINVYYAALESTFIDIKYLIQFIQKSLDTNNKGMMHATQFNLGIYIMYINGIIEYFEENKRGTGC